MSCAYFPGCPLIAKSVGFSLWEVQPANGNTSFLFPQAKLAILWKEKQACPVSELYVHFRQAEAPRLGFCVDGLWVKSTFLMCRFLFTTWQEKWLPGVCTPCDPDNVIVRTTHAKLDD